MLSKYIESADWTKEKHVPVIDCPDSVEMGEPVLVTVTVGREIPHPNEPGHFISWIALYYLPTNAKAPIELARCAFSAHGAGTTEGLGPVALSVPMMKVVFRPNAPGKLYATAYCNLHGLWESEKAITSLFHPIPSLDAAVCNK